MCPGVGKTYAMLQAARQKQSDGCEVVIGIVETHGRSGNRSAASRACRSCRARSSNTAARRSPRWISTPSCSGIRGLAVVDELAHTNAPGSRHPKRYQDVLELLDAGIDVFTTLNVQHIESRRDTVQQITGIMVRETVPDSVLDLANEIVLIDLTPEQLRARLAEGKVYLGDRAARGRGEFFPREQSHRAARDGAAAVAEHVDRDLREIMQEQRIAGPWKSGDRLLVAVRGEPVLGKADPLYAAARGLDGSVAGSSRISRPARTLDASGAGAADALSRAGAAARRGSDFHARAQTSAKRCCAWRGSTTSPKSSSANRSTAAGRAGSEDVRRWIG